MDGDDARATWGKWGSNDPYARPFPIPAETVTRTLGELWEGHGNHGLARLGQALPRCRAEASIIEYDNWNGGIWQWECKIYLPPKIYAGLGSPEDREDVESRAADIVCRMLPPGEMDSIEKFSFGLEQAVTPREGVTNQGRAHSKNVASIEYQGLLFRSPAEPLLCQALYDLGLVVMPLPVVIAKNAKHHRIEPDFVVILKGRVFIIEVDGRTYHRETPVDASRRVEHLENQGVVRVLRTYAHECDSAEKARQCAKEMLDQMLQQLDAL